MHRRSRRPSPSPAWPPRALRYHHRGPVPPPMPRSMPPGCPSRRRRRRSFGAERPLDVGVPRIVRAPPSAFLAPMNRLAYGERMTRRVLIAPTGAPPVQMCSTANGAGEMTSGRAHGRSRRSGFGAFTRGRYGARSTTPGSIYAVPRSRPASSKAPATPTRDPDALDGPAERSLLPSTGTPRRLFPEPAQCRARPRSSDVSLP
jgi:hypothetical protein